MQKQVLILFLFLGYLSIAQEIEKDTLKTEQLEEVVITGQYSKQSVNKSVFEVKVIRQEEIQQNAGNNLSDLLNQHINLNIIPNASTGKSEVNLFGLDGQYFKILKDGIPMVSENGSGNNIDLTQINLDDVKQIEIVEGSMGVIYGANAVSGIINIISDNSSRNKWDIDISAQEETVGNEYEWWAKGRHIQALKVEHNLTDNLFASANFSRNQFAGHFNQKQGKNYIENDGLRGLEWLPKEQLYSNLLLSYHKSDLSVFYKFGVFNELLNYYDQVVTTTYNTTTSQYDKLANDVDYKTIRFTHHLNVSGKLANKSNYDLSVSYQTQSRQNSDYIYDLYTRELQRDDFEEYQYRKTLFSKGTLSNLFSSEYVNAQIGYEITNENGFGSSISGDFGEDVTKTLDNYDAFISSEILLTEKFSLRPGFRYSIQTKFDNQYSSSISSKFDLGQGFELRNILGSSFRTPNYDELYTSLISSNHIISGNESLIPEKSLSIFIHLNKKSWFEDYSKLISKLKIGYIHVTDRIDLSVISTTPVLTYNYLNLDKHNSLNLSLENTFKYKKLDLKLNATLLGVSETLVNEENYSDEFLYSVQVNSSLSYKIPQMKASILLNYKYNGAQPQFIWQNTDDGEGTYIKGQIDAYNWADISIKKQFLKNFEATFGVRNAFDVTRVDSTLFSGGETHTSGGNRLLIGYGRSYFIKLNYNLNF